MLHGAEKDHFGFRRFGVHFAWSSSFLQAAHQRTEGTAKVSAFLRIVMHTVVRVGGEGRGAIGRKVMQVLEEATV